MRRNSVFSYLLFAAAYQAEHNNEIFIPIVMSPDEIFFRPTMVALTSMLENAKLNTLYDVSMLIPGNFRLESKAKLASLKEKYKNFEINFIDMGDLYRHVLFSRYPASAFYRLQITRVFPSQKKILYLDGDVIVRHDLSDLYDINIDDYYVAGVRNPFGEGGGWGLPRNYFKILEIPDYNQYINTGVLLMNLIKMRENDLEEKFSKALKTKVKKILYADQDIITSVCYGKILCLPLKYNLLINGMKIGKSFKKYKYAKMNSTPLDWKKLDPTIVHFSGMGKPWIDGSKTIYHKEFWVYANKTGVYDKKI